MSEPTTATAKEILMNIHAHERPELEPGAGPWASIATGWLPEALARIEADARAPLEAHVVELRAALLPFCGALPGDIEDYQRVTVAWPDFLVRVGAFRHAAALLAATDDPSVRVALRWLRSPEGQVRLAEALRAKRWVIVSVDKMMARGFPDLDDLTYEAVAAAIVAALEKKT